MADICLVKFLSFFRKCFSSNCVLICIHWQFSYYYAGLLSESEKQGADNDYLVNLYFTVSLQHHDWMIITVFNSACQTLTICLPDSLSVCLSFSLPVTLSLRTLYICLSVWVSVNSPSSLRRLTALSICLPLPNYSTHVGHCFEVWGYTLHEYFYFVWDLSATYYNASSFPWHICTLLMIEVSIV